MIGIYSLHNHTEYSNAACGFGDSVNHLEELIKSAKDYGLKGLSITDHEILSSHYKAQKICEKYEDFKLILGNEIYLLTPEEDELMRANEIPLKFPHFLLQALDEEGHYQLRQLSSRAWQRAYIGRGIIRRPTLTTDIEEVVGVNQGHITASTACLGSLFAQSILKLIQQESDNVSTDMTKLEIHKFLTWCLDVFGRENFFIEIQPVNIRDEKHSVDQEIYNIKAVEIAKAYGIPYIVTTDSHYTHKEKFKTLNAFLNSRDGDREVEAFYKAAYLMKKEEVEDYLSTQFSQDVIDKAISNTQLIGNRVKKYDLSHEVIIPKIDLPKFKIEHIYRGEYNKYEYLKEFAYSKNEQDTYLIYQIEKGIKEKILEDDVDEALNRINLELKELHDITEQNGLEFSSYYNTIAKIIELTWTKGDSLVGVGRGSAGAFLICYLLDITQVNPIPLGDLMPLWRHLSMERGVDPPDIDFDTEGSKRIGIIQTMKDYFGEDKVLQVCTFGTLSAKTAIQMAGKGLGYSNDDMDFIKAMIPIERGFVWSLDDCLHGDEEKERKKISGFETELDKYPDLMEVALDLEKLVQNRGSHPAGILILNDDYTKYNACMRSPSGDLTSQFDLHDSEAMSAIKYDFLTTICLDKIRVCMDLLIKDGHMEWQGDLKSTYDKYLYPDKLDYNNKKMWSKITEVPDLFQFDSPVGSQALDKIDPTDILDLSTSNSLMRLAGDGETVPLDLYAKYKRDINLWYEDMKTFGLNEDEINILRKHLGISYGLAESQEKVMLLSMDENIAGFTLSRANVLRKSIAKKDENILKKAKKEFFEGCKDMKTRDLMADYVWNKVLKMSFSYSFSSVHSYLYSVIAMQELNLAHKYPKVYWSTSTLTVNAGANENNENNKSTDYGKIASAIGDIQSRGTKVTLPNINTADFGFRPNPIDNSIVFGLKGISGINDQVVYEIINNRPYKSLQDFMQRLVWKEDSIIKSSHLIQLIKCGAFDELHTETREELMKYYIDIISEPKLSLNMQNFNTVMNYGLVTDEIEKEARYFKFRKHIYSNKPYKIIPNTNPKVKKKIDDELYLLDDYSTEYFLSNFSDDSIEEYVGTNIVISKKEFEKEYTKKIDPLKEWLSRDEILDKLNQKVFDEVWNKHAEGNISKWEMDTLSFYYHEHELSNVDKSLYGIVNFNDLSSEPEVVGYNKYRGRETPKYRIDRIMGTVLDRDKNKHTVSLLTTDGVVNLKFYGGAFGHYDRQISKINEDGSKTVIEKGWIKRGNKIVVTGFRRGDRFIPRKYTDTIYQHTVCLIEEVKDNGELVLKTERERVD